MRREPGNEVEKRLDFAFQAEQLLLQALCDNSQEVREATLEVLLPSVLAWAHELDKLQSDLLELFLQQLELTLLVSNAPQFWAYFSLRKFYLPSK
jgi:hypothetical protein